MGALRWWESELVVQGDAAHAQDGALDGEVVVGDPAAEGGLAAAPIGSPQEAEEAGSRQTVFVNRYLGLMSTIATLAPLLGLLGTVLGMIQAFNVIAVQGVGYLLVWRHLWRNLAGELARAASAAAATLSGEAAEQARRQVYAELTGLIHRIIDAQSYAKAEAALALLPACTAHGVCYNDA